ncbi:hypothetical protein BC830DRAFT_1133876 [Chytriomyces sp. MP71]|nr:hypothetical protein BC830DRAFT_1133876 [Chytriomyces sp. MP71]
MASNATHPQPPDEALIQLSNFTNNCIIVPIYCIGLILNSAVLVALFIKRRVINLSRIEKGAASLILVGFLWSIVNVSKYALFDTSLNSEAFFRTEGILATLFLMTLFALNLSLALDRYLMICGWTDNSIWKAIGMQWLSYLVLMGAATSTYCVTDVVDATLEPDFDYLVVWMVIMGAAFLITFIGTLLANTFAYRASRVQLQQLLAPGPGEGDAAGARQRLLMARINRKMLVRTALMNANLFVCHTPLVVLDVVAAFQSNDFSAAVSNAVGFTAMSLEVVITPMMVWYFFPQFRRIFYRNSPAESEDGSEGPQEPDRSSGDETVVTFGEPAEPTPPAPKFHIIRIVV